MSMTTRAVVVGLKVALWGHLYGLAKIDGATSEAIVNSNVIFGVKEVFFENNV